MGDLYRKDLNKYKKYFKEAAKNFGITVQYYYITKRKFEEQSGESIYSDISKPINVNVIVEQGNPKVESLKQLNWFKDSSIEDLLVDFPTDTPNLQKGCKIVVSTTENENQKLEYVIIKLSNELLYPSHIKCLCQPILNSESIVSKDNVYYGQQDIHSDTENNSFINEEAEIKFF